MPEMAARALATVAASIPEWGTGTATQSLRGLGELSQAMRARGRDPTSIREAMSR